MRVLINEIPCLGRRTGIGRYTAELVPALQAQLRPGESLDGFPRGWLRSLCGWYRSAPHTLTSLSDKKTSSWLGSLKRGLAQRARAWLQEFEQNRFRAQANRGEYDLYHEPNSVPMVCDVPTVTTLHDLSVLLFPQFHPATRVAYYERRFREALARTAHVLTDSAASKREIVQHLGIAPERITAIHLGIHPGMKPVPGEQAEALLRQHSLPPKFLLMVGTIEPRKNQLVVLRAYRTLPAEVRERFPLVLVGGLGWHTEEVVNFLNETGRSQGVIHLGYVTDEMLPVLYSGARALLFPSIHEGFGWPPLEMQACGGAVIASTAEALREVLAGSPAHLLDAHDTDGWRAAMLRVCTEDDWWQTLRAGAMEAAGRFTWERTAEQTLATYRHVLAPARPARISA